MSRRDAWSGARFGGCGEKSRLATWEDRSWISVERLSRAVAMWTLDWREVQSRGRSICSPMERVEMFAGVMGGKPAAGSPRSAAVWWKSETKWSRFPVAGRGERGAGVPILEGPP